jgi:branched-chain amino acid transport system ATP-binding protein
MAGLLSVRGLRKRFGGLLAVQDLDFDIGSGEFVGMIGPNGAGKTTVFNLITGLLTKDRGRVTFRDRDITRIRPHETAGLGICRTFQLTAAFPALSVLENVKLAALCSSRGAAAEEKALQSIQLVGLGGSERMLPGQLPHGHLKRLDVARAVATAPELLLLDEPFSGLAVSEIRDLARVLKDLQHRGITMLVIEHVLRELMPLADRVIVLNFGGKLAEGAPEAIVRNEKVVQAYLGKQWDHAS